MEGERSRQRFVHLPVEIKSWLLPDVDAARPARCPCCGTASRALGAPLAIHGHGVRARQVRGPSAPDRPPETRAVELRRYRCLRCRAVIVVGPLGLLPGWLYSAPAIGWALAQYGVARRAAAEVRRRVSVWPIVGYAASGRWSTLRRWIRAIAAGRLLSLVRRCPQGWTPRQVAERAATTLAAWCPAPDRGVALCHRAWAGAAQLGRDIAM